MSKPLFKRKCCKVYSTRYQQIFIVYRLYKYHLNIQLFFLLTKRLKIECYADLINEKTKQYMIGVVQKCHDFIILTLTIG